MPERSIKGMPAKRRAFHLHWLGVWRALFGSISLEHLAFKVLLQCSLSLCNNGLRQVTAYGE